MEPFSPQFEIETSHIHCNNSLQLYLLINRCYHGNIGLLFNTITEISYVKHNQYNIEKKNTCYMAVIKFGDLSEICQKCIIGGI